MDTSITASAHTNKLLATVMTRRLPLWPLVL